MTRKSGNFTIEALLGGDVEKTKVKSNNTDTSARNFSPKSVYSPNKVSATCSSEIPCRLQLPVPLNSHYNFLNKSTGLLNIARQSQLQTLDPVRSYLASNGESPLGSQLNGGFAFQTGHSRFSPWWMYRLGHYMQQRMQGADGPTFLFQPFRKPKRIRTAFSPSQLLRLESAFDKNHYLVGQERKDLAANLSLTETQVKVWFQNRRTKFKRVKHGSSSPLLVETADDPEDDDVIMSDEDNEDLLDN